jgi:hypothetical protein
MLVIVFDVFSIRCSVLPYCSGSIFFGYGSGSSILGLIPIRIQDFDDQKLEKKIYS